MLSSKTQRTKRKHAGERKLVLIGDYTDITEAERAVLLGSIATR